MRGLASWPDRRGLLLGRSTECASLAALLDGIRNGEGRALVLQGEPGIGKTALLEYLVDAASDITVLRAVGIESEMELAFAGLHQLLAPLLERLDLLPGMQREALEVVFGLRSGAAPDGLFVGLGILSLVSEFAAERPLLCVIDDAHWLDAGSALTLGLVARRLGAEPVGIVVATRKPRPELRSISVLEVRGLRPPDARALLANAVAFTLDAQVRDQIIDETRGNPLALIELPRGLTALQLANGFGVPDAQMLPTRIEENYVRQLDSLSSNAVGLCVLAAADPVGDPLLLWRAAERLGIPQATRDELDAHGLLAIGERVTFRHPLARSAIYFSATPAERRVAHQALAAATDPDTDPDRRAWHLAAGSAGPDEEVALELERSAGRALARGGFAAAAAFRQRALALTLEPTRRGRRAVLAAESCVQAGLFDAARGLLSTAEAVRLDDLQRAQVELVRGQIALLSGPLADAAGLLMTAARSFEQLDVGVARDTYLDAWGAALYAGRLGVPGDLLEVSRAARSVQRPKGKPRPADLLLDSLSASVTDGFSEAASSLEAAARTLANPRSPIDARLSWTWLAHLPAYALWDEERTYATCNSLLRDLRRAGAFGRLHVHLYRYSLLATRCGHLSESAEAIAESEAVTAATGAEMRSTITKTLLAVYRGQEAESTALIRSAVEEAAAVGHGSVLQGAEWAASILYNSLGRYEEALVSASRAADDGQEVPLISAWAMVELVEAATRCGNTDVGESALRRIIETTEFSSTDSARGISARSQALMSKGGTAEELYQEAVDRLGRSRLRPDLARAHLLYGEWLRREGRRVDARNQLRISSEMFIAMGMNGFAQRAERETAATGVHARQRLDETRAVLTPQEAQVALLARDGLSNAEIGTRLFLTARTVEWHLHHVFAKLEISSRKQLRDVRLEI